MATEEEIQAIYENISQPAFEGASTNYRMGQRGLLEGDPDTLASRELLNLQLRSEHAVRNNGIAKAALLKYITSLGAVTLKWKDAEGATHLLAQELWEEFTKNPNLDGYGDFKVTQAVSNSSQFKTGNSYIRLLIRKAGNTNRVPLKLQHIPSSLHDILYNGELEGRKDTIRFGTKFSDSRPVQYFFRKGIQDELLYGTPNLHKHTKVPASELVHSFTRESPGQWLGIPELAPVLLSLYELDDLTDATVAKQKAAQAIAWIVENTNMASATALGTGFNTVDKDGKDKVVFKSTGGNVQYLNKGETVKFYQSTDIGANLPVLIASELRKIASAIGVPYHSLTGNTSGLDFSSLRAIAIELRGRLEFIHHFRTIPITIAPIANRFKELGSLRYSIADAVPTYQLPRWYGVDDLKDSQANMLNLSMGTETLQNILDERHITFEEVVASKSMLEELGLGHIMEGKPDASKQVTNAEANVNSTST